LASSPSTMTDRSPGVANTWRYEEITLRSLNVTRPG
jgi:hypothetical protein